MSWLIKQINNATHEVTLVSDSGDTIQTVIPPDSIKSSHLKNIYLKAQTDAYDAKKYPISLDRDLSKVGVDLKSLFDAAYRNINYWRIVTFSELAIIALLILSKVM